jgi:glycosyltransferase A (GT-A) superfamily protein (DUF2064 family)
MKVRIVVLTKVAVIGQVKSRLAADIGAPLATTLHSAMLDHTLSLALQTGMPVTVSLAGEDGGRTAAAIQAMGLTVEPQGEGHLGDRLRHAMRGPERTIALGSDCVIFEPSWLTLAATDPCAVALGPSDDGGYWTVSIDGGRPDIDDAILGPMPWSQATLFDHTTRTLTGIGVSHHRLPSAFDVDTSADLERLLRDPRCPKSIRAIMASA